MGKGDKKSKKGKQWKKSYGNSRRRKAIKARLKRSTSKKIDKLSSVETTAPRTKRTSKRKTEAETEK